MILRVLLGWLLLSAAVAHADIGDIAAINRLKREAEVAFQRKFWNVAIDKYKTLVERYQVKEAAVLLNLAHAYFQTKEYDMALLYYEQAAKSKDKAVQTVAFQQAAVIKAQSGQLEDALRYLRNSLRASPDNQAARYNYEAVYALLSKKQQQGGQGQQDNKDPSQQNQNRQQQQQNAENKQQQQQGQQAKDNAQTGNKDEQSSEKGDVEEGKGGSQLRSKRLEQVKMTEEEAKNILEGIRNKEVQYLQQMQRPANRRPDRSKPDW
ncbi:hypothetical protein [Rhodoflexus sp.]